MSTITARSRIERGTLALLWLFLLAQAGAASAARSTERTLTPQPLAARKGDPSWEGPQTIQADRRGAISILRPATLEVFPLGENDRLGAPLKLKANAMARPGALVQGAMSAGGDWLIREGPRARLFRDGKEVTLEDSGWYLAGLGWLRDDPLLSVEPARTVPGPRFKGSPPLVLRWTGKAWETLVADEPLPGIEDPLDPAARDHRQVRLLGDSKGTLWAANCYRYLIRRFSPSGKLKLTIAVGKSEVQPRKDAVEAQKSFAREVGKSGLATQKGAAIQAATATPVTDALAEGRDGKMYFLVHQEWDGGDFALDRYDPVRAVLERAPLRLRNVGGMSLASGKDGLYFATFSAERGRWKVSWEDLDSVGWMPVRGAKIDDLEQDAKRP